MHYRCHERLLQAGDHVVVTDKPMGGTYPFFGACARYPADFSYFDTSDTVPSAVDSLTMMLFFRGPILRAATALRQPPHCAAHGVAGRLEHLCRPVIQRPLDWVPTWWIHTARQVPQQATAKRRWCGSSRAHEHIDGYFQPYARVRILGTDGLVAGAPRHQAPLVIPMQEAKPERHARRSSRSPP